ncbi:hypothetical protein KFK09_002995 [Dendrobium nobile]|uniref:Peptidase C14 caspase domain-containing protein n=1 Tax=Dendrobium nobile TaxID=94219 RepID=A0A8T3C6F9_DENNO|nr:hypothetical protein KFK09_002995 [Dendrobium nobile]
MVGKAAVLIGCNYPGTKAELKGCVNDVHRMRRCLIDHFGFTEANITILIDTDDSYTLPTGVNIRRAINRLVRSANPGDDELFLHFSGHGARLPAQPEENDNTGYHECIVPCDMNLIIDEDFRHFVNKLADGCRLTIVADSCNSGGLIENAKEQIGESTAKRKDEAFVDVPAGVELHARAGNGDIHLTGRALPIPILVELLKESTGKEDIHEGNIRSTIIDAFGDSASPRLAKSGHNRGIVDVNGKEESTRDKKQSTFLAPTAPSGRSVLISACQSDQNAADAKPVVKPEGAYGALSNTIQSILADQAKGEVLSNRKLVLMAREKLAKQGFTQRPGLYCTDEVAEEPFLTSDSVV